jgi:Rod binding domain-containing protein
MSNISAFGSIPGVAVGALTNHALSMAKQAGSASSSTTENNKIDKSAKDFESILLGSWLQQAEQSFGSLPGGDEDGDEDSGKEQFEGIAMQSLGTSMTNSGGIGIAKMISKQLHKAEDAENAKTVSTSVTHQSNTKK